MHHLTRPASGLAVAALAVILAGCASQGGGATPVPSSPAAAGSPAVHVVAVTQGSLGAFLAGEDGKTLYILTRDSAGASTCTGTCATTWPPFTLGAGETAMAGAGVTGTIATIKRPDGSDQVAINGQPLYYYVGDSAAGDTQGQGTNGVWFVAAPGGGGVGAPSPAPSATSSGYSY